MTIPPSKLWARLWNCDAIDLRKIDNSFEANISGTDARAYALAGLVEGIATPGGRIRYVRRLARAAKAEIQPVHAPEPNHKPSSASVVTQTNMGVVKEYLSEAIVGLDSADRRVVIGEGKMRGWVHALRPQPPSNWESQMAVIQRQA